MNVPKHLRAIFIGGPLDGQERVVSRDRESIVVALPRQLATVVTYSLVYRLMEATLIYSTLDLNETLERLFNSYTETKEREQLGIG